MSKQISFSIKNLNTKFIKTFKYDRVVEESFVDVQVHPNHTHSFMQIGDDLITDRGPHGDLIIQFLNRNKIPYEIEG